jgi:hypothetical protein
VEDAAGAAADEVHQEAGALREEEVEVVGSRALKEVQRSLL